MAGKQFFLSDGNEEVLRGEMPIKCCLEREDIEWKVLRSKKVLTEKVAGKF